MSSLSEHLAREFPDADQYVPDLPFGTTSRANPEEIAQQQYEVINQICNAQQYESVLFVGHSLGGLIARRIYLIARQSAPTEQKDSTPHWSKNVTRIVLLAGMNRGWQAGHHLSLAELIKWRIGTPIAVVMGWMTKAPLLIMSIRRGAPFITKLRVDWIDAAHKAAEKGKPFPMVVQLLGSIDDMVAPSDNIDLVSGRAFYYLDVPFSGHADVVQMNSRRLVQTEDGTVAEVGTLRRAVLTRALKQEAYQLEDASYIPSDRPLLAANKDITDVVFVVHGIRDVGHWTQKIARAILSRHKKTHGVILMASETSSYGFFPMLPFLLPWKRRQKVEWFMDQLTEAKAEFPNASFSFVGHSHGTYILARALQDYEFVTFKNIVLAGSVVRTGYPWADLIERKQVQNVLNYVATFDWVVAIFPKAIELVNLQDLGSGGHDGFDDLSDQQYRGRTQEISASKDTGRAFVKGAHSAALAEVNWGAIADFVVTGEPPEIPKNIRADAQNVWLARVAQAAPLVWIVLLLIILGGGIGVWHLCKSDVLSTILVGLYGLAIWKVITRL